MLRAVHRIAERHAGEHVVVVTHGGSLRRVQAVVLGMALPVAANCSVWECAYEDGALTPID